MGKKASKGGKTSTGGDGLARANSSDSNRSPKKKGPMVDGFRALPESLALSCREENVAPFTLPTEAFTFTPTAEMVVSCFKNGDKERKIYCNIELAEAEAANLKKLQEEAGSKRLEFLPSIAVMAGRFLSRARGDAPKAIKLMQATQEWRQEYFKDGPVADTEVMEDMKHGIVYFCGRDHGLRPLIVIRATRIPQVWYKERRVDKLVRILIFCMEFMLRYMVVPGTIENNCLVVDLKGLAISQVPFSALSEVYSVMSHHYIGRVFKFYVCNLSFGLSAIAGMVKGLLTDRQRQKLVILDSVKDLRKDFALHQLEEDLGGSRPIITVFFPFPIEAGPFEGGYDGGRDPKAVPGAHALLVAAGVRGRIWDPKLSAEDNTSLEFVPEAYEFFEKHGLPVPPACLRQREARLAAEAAAAAAAAAGPGLWAAASSTCGTRPTNC